MPVVIVVVAIVVIGVVAAVALGRVRGGLVDPRPPRADNVLPPGRLEAADVAGVRFSVALRGYRMDEVDEFVDRMRAELRATELELAQARQARPLAFAPAEPDDRMVRATDLTSDDQPAQQPGGEPGTIA